MGVVYRATDTTLDRTVAVKMIRLAEQTGEAAAQTNARFVREAKAAARVQSRHVAQVLSFGEADDGQHYIVMEHLEGESLSRLLARERMLSPERAIHIAQQICLGLHAAHELGVVHRDLKPSNVMLVRADGDNECVKILDFGVAKLMDPGGESLTSAGDIVGTIAYMAPEQFAGKAVDARADVYALGVLLFRMLAGVPVFDGAMSEIVHQALTKPAPLVHERNPRIRIPTELDACLQACLQKDRNARPANMMVLREQLLAASKRSGPSVARAVVHEVTTTVPQQRPDITHEASLPSSSAVLVPPPIPAETRVGPPTLASSALPTVPALTTMASELLSPPAAPASSRGPAPPAVAESTASTVIHASAAKPARWAALGGVAVALTIIAVGAWVLLAGPEAPAPVISITVGPMDAPPIVSAPPVAPLSSNEPPPVAPLNPPTEPVAPADTNVGKPAVKQKRVPQTPTPTEPEASSNPFKRVRTR
jgi:eukaryotic-like serine/threonine-protein kinase